MFLCFVGPMIFVWFCMKFVWPFIRNAMDARTQQIAEGLSAAERAHRDLELAKDKTQRAIARELIRTLEFTPELRKEAEQARALVEKAWLADVPPDAAWLAHGWETMTRPRVIAADN